MGSEVSVTEVALKSLLRAVTKVRSYPKCLGYESEVDEVEDAINRIKNLLTQKDTTQATLTLEGRNCIRSLNEVICEADDMFDQLLALQHTKHDHDQKQKQKQEHVKSSKKIINFLTRSSSSSLSLSSYSNSAMQREVNRVRKKWHDVSDGLSKLGLPDAADSETDSLNSEETFSQLYEPDVIGRKDDVQKVLGMMLPSENDTTHTSFVSIVGIGGLGKTTLAQLVFNHSDVVAAFPLRIWVFVGLNFNVDDIHAKIVSLAKGKKLEESRFLIVFDDVWSDNEEQLTKLRELLIELGNGGCVLSTTRCKKTADIMADSGNVHELKGLSEEDSWRLLQTTAFDRGEEPESQLVEIGRKISARCCNVPLALKVVGSLLYCQDLRKWLALSTTFDNTVYGSGDLLSALKLSYDNLESPLKCCFTLCALFPKGYRIPKELLISLWMAHGYVEPSPITDECTEVKYTEEIAEQYFDTLIQRCFFQDIESDEYGDVVSCRIHDLLYDFAQQLVGEEIGVVESLGSVTAKHRHVLHDRKEDNHASFGKISLRTYLQSDINGNFPVATVVANCMSLRALSLHNLDDSSLPETIGKLLHLRYLDLSRNKKLETLPKSLTKLCNLETLDLRDCSSLTELPSDLSSLMLRRLDISGCTSLTCMPPDMKIFKCLRTLTLFVMDEGDLSHGFEDLETLHNLKGYIEILIPANYTISAENENQGKCLTGKADLKAVCIHFRESDHDAEMQLAVLDKLQPHKNLQGLTLKGFFGSEFHLTDYIEKLVKLELRFCKGLINLQFIGELKFLKSLILDGLENLEYVQDASTIVSLESNEHKIFPSLEYLKISGLPKFGNWWGGLGLLDKDHVMSQFPCVFHLVIESCPKLASFPLCPAVEKLCLTNLNENFSVYDLNPKRELILKVLEIDNINYLRAKLVIRRIIKSKSLTIRGHVSRQSEDEFEDDEPWKLVKDNLRNLELDSMESMTTLPTGMKHLTDLQHLTISHCNNLNVIPEWISCLVSLETLHIRYCTGVKNFPESMQKLTSLRHLEIEGHTYLQKRCEAIHGEDWSKLQHIQSFSFH